MHDYAVLVRCIYEAPAVPDAEALALRLGPRACMLRAVALARLGLRGSARRELARAVHGAPTDPIVLTSAGLVAYVCRNYDDAVSLFDRAARAGGGVSALRLKFRVAARLGWKHEAREAIEAAIAHGGAQAARWHAEALALFSLHRAYDLAIHHGRAAVALRPDVPALHMELANIYAELDDAGATCSAIAQALQLQPGLAKYRLEAARMLVRIGRFDEAREELHVALRIEPRWAPAHEALGSLALWSGWDEQAEHHGRQALNCDPCFAPAARLLGAHALMRGEVHEARWRFEQALRLDPSEPQTHLFRAELALGAGRVEEAHDALSRAMAGSRSYLFAAQLLRLLAIVRDHEGPSFLPGRTAHLIKGVSELCPELAERLHGGAVEVWEQALTTSLERMRGNRSATPTYLAGEELKLLRTGLDPRFDSRRALETIQVCTPAETLTALDEVVHTHGSSSLPLAHKGELFVWLGDLAAARTALEQAIEIDRGTRWAYIGLTAIAVLEGDPERAFAASARSVAAMNNTEGPAVPLLRGEALWMLGRLAEAEGELERASALHPSRISAVILLGLLRVEQGDAAGARSMLERLKEQAAGLLSDAAQVESIELFGDEAAELALDEMGRLLGRMRAMLRGNRSSTCITYFTASGRLRSVQKQPYHGPPLHEGDMDDLEHARLLLERAVGIARLPALRPRP